MSFKAQKSRDGALGLNATERAAGVGTGELAARRRGFGSRLHSSSYGPSLGLNLRICEMGILVTLKCIRTCRMLGTE